MELTAGEREAVEQGDLVKCLIPDSRVQCVVAREDLLERPARTCGLLTLRPRRPSRTDG